MRYGLFSKCIFICAFFLAALEINSTPTFKQTEDNYEDTIEKIAEIIYENHNIDIENRALNYGFYGYKVEYENACNLTLGLMDYKKKERFFKVDFCKNKSNFFKIVNHGIAPN